MGLKRASAAWTLLALSACNCGGGGLGGVAVGFTVSGDTVDFGRVLEGTQESRSVTLVSTGSVELAVDVATSGAPFNAPTSVQLPGGGRVDVPVVFTAGSTVADGTLALTAHGKTVSIPLHGEGIRPLPCTPSAPCRVSVFDLNTGKCVESPAPEGAACVPSSICLDDGICTAGQCVGSPRNCDDANACTNDGCAEGQGCIHTPKQCPAPTDPCQVAVCDPALGCGFGPASDGTPCGSLDCVTVNLCLTGACQPFPTPDGFPCSPATPCQGGGRCGSQKCIRPDAGDLSPSYASKLLRAPVAAPHEALTLLAYRGNLFWAACDGGCALESFTFNCIERFAQPFADARTRWLVAVTDAGVVVSTGDGLEAYDQETGVPLWTLPGSALAPPAEIPGGVARTQPPRASVSPQGVISAVFSWWPGPVDAGYDAGLGAGNDGGQNLDGGNLDGGGDAGDGGGLGTDAGPVPGLQTLVEVQPDGGLSRVQVLRAQGTRSRVAQDPQGTLYAYDPVGPLVRARPSDGGWTIDSLGAWTGLPSLVETDGTLLVGASWLIPTDGGIKSVTLDAGAALSPDPRIVLAANHQAYLLERTCLPPFLDPCADVDKTTLLSAVDLTSAAPLWTAEAAPPSVPVEFHEAALVSGGGVCTLSETQFDAGAESHVQLFAQGQRLFTCRIPPPGTLGGGVFEDGLVYVFMYRAPDWWLEAYSLGGVPFESSGWPQRNGVSGTRQEH